jgi:DNA-directed RNA polymerase specialized sigma24 family protein
MAETINWLALSERSQETLREIELRIWLGFSPREVADELKISPSLLRRHRASLRREIEEQLRGAEA